MTALPLVIAHRGASGYEPENTMCAFAAAQKMQADGIELDIFETQDKHLVVTHDENTSRITGVNKSVRHSSLHELLQLDFGKNEKIPVLEQVLEEFLEKFQIINIEIKSHGYRNTGIEENLVKLIKRFKATDKLLISSFNPVHLYRVKRLLPDIRIGHLICEKQNRFARSRPLVHFISPDTLNLDIHLFDTPKFKWLFQMNRPKWLWTVNKLEDMEKSIEIMPEAMITNYPDKLREKLKN